MTQTTGQVPVLVTGATGRIGSQVVAELLRNGTPVRALTRDPSRASLPDSVDVVAGDFTDPDSLDAALKGVTSVFLLWTAPVEAAQAVIHRLESTHRHVVFLSSPHTVEHPFFQQPNPMALVHTEIERLLTEAALDTTFLRPGMFASNAQYWWGPAISAGEPVRWPFAEAETAPIDERDVAAVAATCLQAGQGSQGDYVLTGPQALTQREQVQAIGEVLGRALEFAELSPAEFREETSSTWPAPVVAMLLDAWSATLGHPAYITSSVADILQRPALTFRQWATDNIAAFRSSDAQ